MPGFNKPGLILIIPYELNLDRGHLNIIKVASVRVFDIKDKKCDDDFTLWPSHDVHNTVIDKVIRIWIREVRWREFPGTHYDSVGAAAFLK